MPSATSYTTPSNARTEFISEPPAVPSARDKKLHAPVVSIVLPMYNEEENLAPMLRELIQAGDLLNTSYEIIIVDDGSTDQLKAEIKPYLEALPGVLKYVELARNFGQSAAMAAGLDIAEGRYIVTLDGDLQNDPADIPQMLTKLVEDDLDMVIGWRQNRQDKVLNRKIPSWIANRIIGFLSGLKFTDYGCSLKVYRREIAKSLKLYGELHRFIPFLASIEGARIAEVPVNHRARLFGQSKYNLSRTLKVVLDLTSLIFIRRFFSRPFHMFGRFGMLLGTVGTVLLLELGYEKLFLHHHISQRPALILGAVLLLAGLQMLSTGLLAEIQIRNFYNQNEPRPYRIRHIYTMTE